MRKMLNFHSKGNVEAAFDYSILRDFSSNLKGLWVLGWVQSYNTLSQQNFIPPRITQHMHMLVAASDVREAELSRYGCCVLSISDQTPTALRSWSAGAGWDT